MAETTSSEVTKSLTVRAPVEIAWRVFTAEIGKWWPLESHKIGAVRAVDAVIEPRAGGRWYERGEDGSSCDWGRVLVWEPPGRLVLTWEITADWKHDPGLKTEVEVTFAASEEGTRVSLVHRHLERFGARAAEMVQIFSSPGGWDGLLAAFGARANAPR